jgi:hypothetical protein
MSLSYSKRFVAFIDILGFRDIIARSTYEPPEITIEKILSALNYPGPVAKGKMLIGKVGDISESNHKATQFSDNIVISTDHNEAGLLYLVDHIEHIVFNLLKLGFFCRGGISSGPLYHNKNIVFGPAMVEAYDLERYKAVHPRVILSENVARFACSMNASQGTVMMRKIYKCEDYYMVHALRLLALALGIPGGSGKFEMDYLNIWLHLRKEMSRLSNPEEKKKIKWFKKYFESTISVNKLKLIMAVQKQQG